MSKVKTNHVLSSLFSVSSCKLRCCILGSAATAWRRKAQTNHWLKLSILGRGWNSLFAFFCWRFYFRTYWDNWFACWFRDVSSIGEGSLISGTRQLLNSAISDLSKETIYFFVLISRVCPNRIARDWCPWCPFGTWRISPPCCMQPYDSQCWLISMDNTCSRWF